MASINSFTKLPTEQINPRSREIDRVSTKRALQLINQEDASVAKAVRDALPEIETAVDLVARSILFGGRVIFLGAGTSGRLGVMEAAECPPTFNTPPSMIQAYMAGGQSSVFRSKEGAEDRGKDAVKIVRRVVRSGDVVIGIAASGVTPYVREGLEQARHQQAKTIFITCHSGKFKTPAEHTIVIKTGPEVIAGSTRLKAATATKMVLNSITVASMVKLGKVYGNLMVDLQPKSAKLRARAAGLIARLAEVSPARAVKLLKDAGGNAKIAIVMARKKISHSDAADLLESVNGHLYLALR